MSTTSRPSASSTSPDHDPQVLPRPPHRYEPFYAIYLLEQRMGGGQPLGDSGSDARGERVRLRPTLSMAQPAAPVARAGIVPETPDRPERAVMVQRFFGLCGAASPLPLWYSEVLLQQETESRRRDEEGLTAASLVCGFIDILNHRALSLRYRAWLRNHMALLDAKREPSVLRAFSTALRLAVPRDASALQVARSAALLLLRNRPAMGLSILLQDLATAGQLLPDEPRCPVEVCQLAHTVRIPIGSPSLDTGTASDGFAAPRLGRGMRLGQDLLVGESLLDRQCQLAVRLGPMNHASMLKLLHRGSPEQQRLVHCVASYVRQPFMLHMEALVPRCQIPPAKLTKRGESSPPLRLSRQAPLRLRRNDALVVLLPAALSQVAAGLAAAISEVALRILCYADVAEGLALARLHKPTLIVLREDSLGLADAVENEPALADTLLLFSDAPDPLVGDVQAVAAELHPRVRAALFSACDTFRARVQLEPQAHPAFH